MTRIETCWSDVNVILCTLVVTLLLIPLGLIMYGSKVDLQQMAEAESQSASAGAWQAPGAEVQVNATYLKMVTATKSTTGTLVAVQERDHDLHEDVPDLVPDTIQQMVEWPR